jgi:23S rRNA (guanosine2251-2'-O)-methyltransferase
VKNKPRSAQKKFHKPDLNKKAAPTHGKEPNFVIPKNWRVIIGHHAILEALITVPKSAIEMLWLKQGWEGSQELKELHQEHRSKITKIEIKAPATLDRFGSHQGAALFVSSTPALDWAALQEKKISKVVVLDGIEDPHNLGAILRSCWLMDVDAVFIPEDRAVGLTPTAHKVASGGAEHVPVVKCVNFTNPIEDLKKMGYWEATNNPFSLSPR